MEQTQKPQVFFFGGMYSGPDFWPLYFLNEFEQAGYDVKILTLPYHYITRRGREIVYFNKANKKVGIVKDFDALAKLGIKDCVDFVREQLPKDPKSILITHSMSGLIGQYLASMGLLSALVLLAPCPPPGISAMSLSGIISFWDIIKKFNVDNKVVPPPPWWQVRYVTNRLPKETARKIFENMICESGTVFEDMRHGRSAPINQMPCSVLIINGDCDRIIRARVAREIFEKYSHISPETTISIMPGMGHLLMYEQGWKEVTQNILTWLKNK